MPAFKSYDEYEEDRGQDYGSLPEEEYRFKVTGVTELPPEIGQYDPEGKKPRLRVFVAPVALADDPDAPLLNTLGEELNPDKSVLLFYDPSSVGFRKDGTPSKYRKFVATILGVNPKGNVTFNTYDDFINKEFYGAIEHKNGYDKMGDIRPIRRATRPAPAAVPAPAPAIVAAKEAFPDATVADEEDALPF